MRAQLSQAEGGVGWLGLLPQSWKALGWPWYKTGECGVSDHNNELIQVVKIPVIHAGSKFSAVSNQGARWALPLSPVFWVPHGNFCCGAWAPERVGFGSCDMQAELSCSMWNLSSPTRDRTCISCPGRQILNHWATREAPSRPCVLTDSLKERSRSQAWRTDLGLSSLATSYRVALDKSPDPS